ncbi:hypothetical protein [Aeromicrobium fastidiosum]|uniref:DUF732 domain-containing protein n=1 Tax=Aeromicrobium fastidiosum TaxID=52699 RepID=A0A641AUM8_9ACTN|nr:hypothetical protein [Aeromicrobium fastidiosum]KAA1380711.1 hypothetical protein ESP62_005980 [Aeromicrobium fastidiosum]MBP2390325.1 hypothetical protein [Aeromicrobium fastidiosum]
MQIRSRTATTALVLMLSMGGTLAACGGSSDDGGTSEPSSAPASSADSDPTTEAPATEAEPEGDSDGDKPSREDVVAGYVKAVGGGTTNAETDAVLEKSAKCVVDELYDKASAETLRALADSDLASINPDDAKLFGDASGTCASAGS